MALTKVDDQTYRDVVSRVPERENGCLELRKPGCFYPVRQYVFDEQGRLVAFCDDSEGTGERWADLAILNAS